MKLKFPKRKSIRLLRYDYSQAGYYFITICAKDRRNLFGTIDVGTARYPLKLCFNGFPLCGRLLSSEVGQIIEAEIKKIDEIYEGVEIIKYVIMPNHVHIIISLNNESGRPQAVPTVSRIVNQFKGSISKKFGYSIWQSRFHDHVIRNESEYQKIWQYIDENPIRWANDCYYT